MPKRRATKVPVVKAPKPRRVKAAPVASSPAPVLESLRSTLRGGLVGSREDMRARLQLGADEED